ncbi:MAG: serine hydrolase [Pseudomonadota bacterium]
MRHTTKIGTSILLTLAGMGLWSPSQQGWAQSPPGAEPIVFSRHISHARRSQYQTLHDEISGTGFVPVSAQSPANSRYNVVWHRDANILSSRIHTNMSRKSYEDRRDDYQRDKFVRSFVTAYSDDGEIRYNAIWIKEEEERQRRVHSRMTEKELLKRLKSYRRKGYTPVDILPWRHDKKVYYSVVWIKDRREVEWIVDVSRSDWEKFHKKKRQEGFSLRDIGMLGASRLDAVRYSGVWVKDPAIKTHHRVMGITAKKLNEVMEEFIHENYRVSDLDSVYVDDEIRYSVLLHRPARRNRIVSNYNLPEDVEDTLLTLLESYRTSATNGGNVGFFIENFETGNYIAYNPDEHYFMSSTRKVILAASALQNGFKVGDRRSVDLDLSDFRSDTRGEGTTAGGIEYPSITRRSLSRPLSPSGLLAAMLVESDNTAADYFYNNWAGMRELRKTLEDTGTKNFGEMISKCDQEARSIALKKGHEDVVDVRCHVLREWIENDGTKVSWGNRDENDILKGKYPGRGAALWRRHIDRHYNAITPRAYAGFFRDLADGDLLNRYRREDLLRHMGTRNSLFGQNQFDPELYDRHVAKNGGTYRNRAWVVFTWNWRSRNRWRSIIPRHSFVFMTEDQNQEDKDLRQQRADNLAEAIWQLVAPTTDCKRCAKRNRK